MSERLILYYYDVMTLLAMSNGTNFMHLFFISILIQSSYCFLKTSCFKKKKILQSNEFNWVVSDVDIFFVRKGVEIFDILGFRMIMSADVLLYHLSFCRNFNVWRNKKFWINYSIVLKMKFFIYSGKIYCQFFNVKAWNSL